MDRKVKHPNESIATIVGISSIYPCQFPTVRWYLTSKQRPKQRCGRPQGGPQRCSGLCFGYKIITGQVAQATFVSVIALTASNVSRRFKMNRNMTAMAILSMILDKQHHIR